jgi:ribonuclease Z
VSAASLALGELAIEGRSHAGEETWFRVRPPGLGLDAGRGAGPQVGVRDLFLSHGHLDHACGVPWLLSQRRLLGGGATRVLCPAAIAAELGRFVAAAEALERVAYEHTLVPLEPGDRVDLGGGFALEPFALDHVVPALGCHLIRRRRSLRPGLAGLPGAELGRRRAAGEPVDDEREEILLSYCGDTGPGVFARAPRLGESRVVLVECTFLGEPARARGAAYGHLHVADLAEHAAALAGCETIVLHHRSRRHRAAELRSELERLAPALAARTVLFPD